MMSDRAKLLAVLVPVVAANLFIGVDIYRLSAQREIIKWDYSQVNSIRYGLLSVDAWKERTREILEDRIGTFTLNPEHEAVLREEISHALNALITEADLLLRKHQETLSGTMRKIAIRTFVSVPEMRKQVPVYAQAILTELQKPSHARKLKTIAKNNLDQYAEQSYDSPEDTERFRAILSRYQVQDSDDFNLAAKGRLRELESDIKGYCILMLDGALAFLAAWWFCRTKPELHRTLFSLSIAFALILLGVGLALPMIDLDARIKSVDLLLWGEHLRFYDQVLFFRSKSIIQVITVLFETLQPDSVIVAMLLTAFSVLFPLSKLAAMQMYMRGTEKVRNNAAINFFAFKSGKWSMADVTVVAIFIAYIGFKGILSTQLAGLNIKDTSMEIIATNDTSLQPGFILFTAFVLFGFALSEILKRMPPSDSLTVDKAPALLNRLRTAAPRRN